MERIMCPRIISEKRAIPTIYLDSCAIIELARHTKGICKNHSNEVGELYCVLSSLMQSNSILCPYGNQLPEVGMTANRKGARNFLYSFTNIDYQDPDSIFDNQMEIGFQAFINRAETIELGIDSVYEEMEYQSPFRIHVAPVYTEEKSSVLKGEKEHIAEILNGMKIRGEIRREYADQLKAELEAEYISFFNNTLNNPMDSEESVGRYVEEITRFYRITGTYPGMGLDQYRQETVRYGEFLTSAYHDYLPYIWIRANLWTHLMQRQNKIKKSDNLDIQWAAAYLPYIHYAVTDNDFCNVLYSSGMADLYQVKVYSLSTLKNLLNELTNR